MTFRSLALPCMLLLAGCPMTIPNDDGGGSSSDSSCHITMPDLAPSPAKCAAAKGLTGENVVCVDFPTKGSLTELTGWNFKAAGGSDCWTLAVGQQTGKKVLLVNSFSSYSGECALTTPQIDLSLPERKDYSRLTLSILERTDVNPATANNGPQFAQVFLNNTTFLLNQTTNKNNPRQLILTLDKATLPAMPSGGHQFYLNFHAPYGAGGGNLGWEIESIAVNLDK